MPINTALQSAEVGTVTALPFREYLGPGSCRAAAAAAPAAHQHGNLNEPNHDRGGLGRRRRFLAGALALSLAASAACLRWVLFRMTRRPGWVLFRMLRRNKEDIENEPLVKEVSGPPRR